MFGNTNRSPSCIFIHFRSEWVSKINVPEKKLQMRLHDFVFLLPTKVSGDWLKISCFISFICYTRMVSYVRFWGPIHFTIFEGPSKGAWLVKQSRSVQWANFLPRDTMSNLGNTFTSKSRLHKSKRVYLPGASSLALASKIVSQSFAA